MEITVTGPGTLNFYWKVDSRESSGVRSVEVLSGADYDEINGSVDWTSGSVTISSSPQTV